MEGDKLKKWNEGKITARVPEKVSRNHTIFYLPKITIIYYIICIYYYYMYILICIYIYIIICILYVYTTLYVYIYYIIHYMYYMG